MFITFLYYFNKFLYSVILRSFSIHSKCNAIEFHMKLKHNRYKKFIESIFHSYSVESIKHLIHILFGDKHNKAWTSRFKIQEAWKINIYIYMTSFSSFFLIILSLPSLSSFPIFMIIQISIYLTFFFHLIMFSSFSSSLSCTEYIPYASLYNIKTPQCNGSWLGVWSWFSNDSSSESMGSARRLSYAQRRWLKNFSSFWRYEIYLFIFLIFT